MKQKVSIFLLAFLSIAIALLIAFSMYFCLIKDKPEQKYLLQQYVTNEKLINKYG